MTKYQYSVKNNDNLCNLQGYQELVFAGKYDNTLIIIIINNKKCNNNLKIILKPILLIFFERLKIIGFYNAQDSHFVSIIRMRFSFTIFLSSSIESSLNFRSATEPVYKKMSVYWNSGSAVCTS